jgi:glucose/mannose-6-phosphate isomerase
MMSREDEERHYRIDESRMLDHALGAADQIEEAWRLSKDLTPAAPRKGEALVICAMGGSAIGGHLLSDMIRQDSDTPVFIEKGYNLPTFASRNTPVVCVSYSGNTEEVLASFENALLMRCPVVVISSGGELGERAVKAGVPYLKIPGGMPPRAALGYLFTPLIHLVSHWRIYETPDEDVDSAVRKTRKLAKKYSFDGDPAENTALQLAKRLYGKIPLIYSGSELLMGAAYRWKCQFNENSKTMAFSAVFPELGHNEIMGWECPEKLREDSFLIMLRDVQDHPRIQKRMDVTFRVLEPLAGGAVMIDSEGTGGSRGRLSRLLSILILGDLTSIYLAVEYGKDPTPIEKIEMIKQELRSED